MIAEKASPPGKLRARWGALVFVIVLLFSWPQAALLPLLDRDEPRFAEASREMLQSGNFIVPTFDHAPRYAKPPLIYWSEAVSYLIFGENAFAARLPSLLATAATAALLVEWGCALGSLEMGLIAALGNAFCLQTMQQGRVATADALMIFFVALSGFAGWKMIRVTRDRDAPDPASPGASWNKWSGVLALSLGLGFLAKGPEALLPVFPILFCLWREGPRIVCRLLAILALALLLVSAWALPAFVQTNGAYWREGLGHDVGDRMVSSFQGHGANSLGGYLLGLPFYVLLFWVSALPWSALLISQRRALLGKKRDETDTYLLLQAGFFFIIFSLLVTKLPHYTLPAFPFLALLFARRWRSSGLPIYLPLGLTGGCGLVLAGLTLVLVPLVVLPRANPSPTGTLVREAGPALKPETEFALVDFQEPNTIWEMRRVVRGYSHALPKRDVLAFLSGPGPRAVLLSSALWPELQPPPNQLPSLRVFSAPGWNAARVSFVNLTLVVNGK